MLAARCADVGTGALDTNDQTIQSLNTAGGANASGTITMIADEIDLGTTADAITTTGSVLLRPIASTVAVNVSTADAENAGSFNLNTFE